MKNTWGQEVLSPVKESAAGQTYDMERNGRVPRKILFSHGYISTSWIKFFNVKKKKKQEKRKENKSLELYLYIWGALKEQSGFYFWIMMTGESGKEKQRFRLLVKSDLLVAVKTIPVSFQKYSVLRKYGKCYLPSLQFFRLPQIIISVVSAQNLAC